MTDEASATLAGIIPKEAPTGFDNLTNGFSPQGPAYDTIDEDNVSPGASFNDNRFIFEEVETKEDGLGPTYNAQSCRECHQNVVTGGAKSPEKPFYRAIDYSPYSNDLLVAFAEEAITKEGLGTDDDPDVLTMSFSANDHVGHRFGPDSQEVMDMALRVDRQIGTLLDFVDEHVGLKNTIVVFTADHGVAPVPEYRTSLKLPGRRMPWR